MSISVAAFASAPLYTSGSIRVSDTSAIPVGLRSRVPAKITSSIRDPRRVLADCSPKTHEIASEMFDFPQPLGPMIAAMPSPWNLSSVRSQNDLNPRICSLFSLSNASTPVASSVVSGHLPVPEKWVPHACPERSRKLSQHSQDVGISAARGVYQTDSFSSGIVAHIARTVVRLTP